jgi:hypothetical protein
LGVNTINARIRNASRPAINARIRNASRPAKNSSNANVKCENNIIKIILISTLVLSNFSQTWI